MNEAVNTIAKMEAGIENLDTQVGAAEAAGGPQDIIFASSLKPHSAQASIALQETRVRSLSRLHNVHCT